MHPPVNNHKTLLLKLEREYTLFISHLLGRLAAWKTDIIKKQPAGSSNGMRSGLLFLT
jgi:hypothetical protein